MKKLTAKFLAPFVALVIGTPALAADVERVDINTATQEQLKSTLGVNDAEAQKIIDARPYQKKDDLTAKGVLSQDEFSKLQKLIDSVC